MLLHIVELFSFWGCIVSIVCIHHIYCSHSSANEHLGRWEGPPGPVVSPMEKRDQGRQLRLLSASWETHVGLISEDHWENIQNATTGKQMVGGQGLQQSMLILVDCVSICSGTQVRIPASSYAQLQSRAGNLV